MQLPQTESLRSALRPRAARLKNSADTAAQDDVMPIANANSARMQQAPSAERCLISSPKPAPCSIRLSAQYRMQLPQTESIRSALRPLAARLKTARTLPSHKMTQCPPKRIRQRMPQAPAAERGRISCPAKLHLAAIGTQRGIVCSSRRRNLSAARYAPRHTVENSADAASSHPQKPAPCSIQSAARYRMQFPQMEFIRSALRPSPHG